VVTDGSRVAFLSNRDGNWEVYIVKADGSGLQNLTNHAGQDSRPLWSPDGGQIAFEGRRDGQWEIFLVAINGTALTNLTNNLANEGAAGWRPGR
jgi:Tol biopolymer transport system component